MPTRPGLGDDRADLGRLHRLRAVDHRIPGVVEDLSAKRRQMQQPAGGDLMAGLTARRHGTDAGLFLDDRHELDQLVICRRHREAMLFENILPVSEDRGLGAEWNAVERAGLAGQIPLLAADDAAVLKIGVRNIVDVVLRIDQRAVGEELAERRQKPLGDILTLPHHHPGDDVVFAFTLGHLQQLPITELQILQRVHLDLDAGLLGERLDQSLGRLEMAERRPADHDGGAFVGFIRVGERGARAEAQQRAQAGSGNIRPHQKTSLFFR